MSIIDNLPSNDTAIELLSKNNINKILDVYNPLVEINAMKWKKFTLLPLDDLYQEGRIALVKAANSYDLQFGTKFTTWAITHIDGAIRTAINKEKKFTYNHISISGTNENDDSWSLEDQLAASDENINSDTLEDNFKEYLFYKILRSKNIDLINLRYNLKI